jgi:transposase
MEVSEFKNYEDMFAQSIGISDPWKIEKAEFDEGKREVHIYVSARKTAKYECSECGSLCERYDDEETERIWRHGDVVFFPCYVHCRRPRIKCGEHGLHVATAPWARKNSRYTLLFESYAMLMVKAMPVENARKLLRISHTSMTRILRYWVKKAVEEDDLSGVHAICVDETSFKRGQSYVTVVSDAAARRVIYASEGRGADNVENFSYTLEEKGGSCEKIDRVACDMSAGYMSGVDLCFPNAKITIDKFHVKQSMLKAMDEVRREEQGRQKSRQRSAGKKLLMIPEGRMNEQQAAKLQALSAEYPKTGRAFRMVQGLDTMYACKGFEDADGVFKKLISWLRRSRLEPMKRVANTLKKYRQEILSYFYSRLTNAIAEGINSLIQSAKRRARGFRTIEGYICMIYLVVGRLNLSCPKLFA